MVTRPAEPTPGALAHADSEVVLGLGTAVFVLPLDGSGRRLSAVGGKGASLDTLVKLGFRVPPGVGVTTAAYRHFVASAPGLQSFLDDLRGRPVPTPDQAETELREVERAFLDTPVPDEVRRAVAPHVDELVEGRYRLAVRSSATAEDLKATSFAGQHLSVLDVEGLDQALDAVRSVWASLWHPAPRTYRERMGVPDADLAMAVVIQRMVRAERSGVVFTRDPTKPGTLRVEWIEGLGEALVSGEATPTVQQLVLPSLRPADAQPIDAVLRDVARTAMRIEEEMGGEPQDVEWSSVGREVWVLQSRPITTMPAAAVGDGFDTTNRPGHHYAASGVAEMLPGVLSPLLWTVNGPMIEEAFRHLFWRLGILPDDAADDAFAVLARINGRAALNLSRVKDAARSMAGGTGAEVERQYLGHVVSESGPEPSPSLRQRMGNLGASARALRLRKRAVADAATFEHAVREVVDLDLDLRELRSSELLAYRARVRDLAASGIGTEVAVAVAAVASYRALEVALERWTGDEAGAWAQRITRDASGGQQGACACVSAIWEVFEDVAAHEQLTAVILDAGPEEAEDRLRSAGAAGEALVERLWEALRRMGSSAVYGGATWDEQRDFVWRVLLGCLRARLDRDRNPITEAAAGARNALADLERRLTRTWRWRLTRVVTGQVVDVRRRMLRQLSANARDLLSLRESVKAAVLQLGGAERRATRALAERLVRRGDLRSVDDVEMLADWELDDLVSGASVVSRDEIERRRTCLEEYEAQGELGELVDHRGAPVEVRPDTDGIEGWGASPGVHRGRARVVRRASDATDLEPGDVLVAPSTDPSWTPLFLVAGGVIVERGGPLSHAAIVARELGLPAVLNAVGATRKIPDGASVEVDGDRGVVIVLDGPTAPEEAA